jgi:hypothetical protein
MSALGPAGFQPPPDQLGQAFLEYMDKGDARRWIALVVTKKRNIGQPGHQRWGVRELPGFVFTQRFFDQLAKYLGTVDPAARFDIGPHEAPVGYHLQVLPSSDDMTPVLEEAISIYVYNGVYGRILGMGAGAGAERHGGTRRTRRTRRVRRVQKVQRIRIAKKPKKSRKAQKSRRGN